MLAKCMHQIARNEYKSQKFLQLLRGAHPPSDTPFAQARTQRRWRAADISPTKITPHEPSLHQRPPYAQMRTNELEIEGHQGHSRGTGGNDHDGLPVIRALILDWYHMNSTENRQAKVKQAAFQLNSEFNKLFLKKKKKYCTLFCTFNTYMYQKFEILEILWNTAIAIIQMINFRQNMAIWTTSRMQPMRTT